MYRTYIQKTVRLKRGEVEKSNGYPYAPQSFGKERMADTGRVHEWFLMKAVTAQVINRRIGSDCVHFDGLIRVQDEVYWLTDDPNIAADCDSPDYVGYDSISEHYDREPAPSRVINTYWKSKHK